MANWMLNDIPWDQFDPSRVDPDIVPLIKAASVVEYNSGDYSAYLGNVFHDDPRLRAAVKAWAREERQHGQALARWAQLADPGFDFDASFKRFTDGFRPPIHCDTSVRGSRAGELIARCMVETGTTSYYTALAEATGEPVLKAICRHIAQDEVSHYWLFYNHMNRYMRVEKLGFWRRLTVALRRIAETEDEELAYAYYAANASAGAPFDRRRNTAAYGRRAMPYWTPGIVREAVSMMFVAVGLKGDGGLGRAMAFLACGAIRLRQKTYVRKEAPPV